MNNKLMVLKEISFMGFKAVPLTSKIDWLENPYNNRTWMWHLHQMSYITDLIEYDKEYLNNKAVEYSLEIIKSWFTAFEKDLENVFAWHDHATALRAQNISKLYLYLKEIDYENKIIIYLERILNLHLKMLVDENFYSQFTNHGLDQSLALYELANVLSDTNKIKELSVNRINTEISHAFSSDGGHVENSPAYLNFGLKQVLEALTIGKTFEGKNSKISFPDNIFNNAIKVLAFFTQPNGKLPLLGDTKDFEVRNFFENIESEEYQNFLYSIRKAKQGKMPLENYLVLPKSGWAIFRESWEKESFVKSTHIVFKCGFLSNYHRHDDDLHFTLFSDGEEWLVDGGEYKHAPKDPYRIYMRSADSHNLSKPYNLRAHRILEDSKNTGIKKYYQDADFYTVEAKSYMFRNFENYRKLSYNKVENKIIIDDKCIPISEDSKQIISKKYEQNFPTFITKFQIPKDKKVMINTNNKTVEIEGKNKKLILQAPNFSGNIKLVKAQIKPTIQGWVSRKSGILEESYTLEYYHKTKELEQSFIFNFQNITKKSIIEIATILSNNQVTATIETSLNKNALKYAFYLMDGDEKIQQRWYEESNKVNFEIDLTKDISQYSVIGFIRDKSGKKYQKKYLLKNCIKKDN
ncbi:hypothetical protein ALC152_07440 [Arcobacter sp. 15-2]|uniref:heparinase II/III family protein n=1 Tax=Arcobacter sp. 15-2 TaxID=3374109 RepID=UPI00399D4C70